MLRIFCGSILMLFAMTGCSGDTPTAPMTRDEIVLDQTGLKKSAVTETDILIAAVSPSVNPVIKTQKETNPREGAMTRRTWKAAHRLEQAVQDYARDNEGIFPGDLHGPNMAGKTLLAYLPGGQMLKNTFTNLRTEPSGYFAEYSGAIGYNVYIEGTINVGYIISAMGVDSDEILVLVYDPD